MRGALVIFIAMVAIGVVLYLIDLLYYRRKKGLPPVNLNLRKTNTDESSPEKTSDVKSPDPVKSGESEKVEEEQGEVCCGMHAVCEKTTLMPVSAEVVYYDDEELDRFRGRMPESYTPEETEEFRDVLMTLLPEDVAGWSRSIQLREIALPYDVRDELLMIVSELRQRPQ